MKETTLICLTDRLNEIIGSKVESVYCVFHNHLSAFYKIILDNGSIIYIKYAVKFLQIGLGESDLRAELNAKLFGLIDIGDEMVNFNLISRWLKFQLPAGLMIFEE